MEWKGENRVLRINERIEELKKFYRLLMTAVYVSIFSIGGAVFLAEQDLPYATVPIGIFISTPCVCGVILLVEYFRVVKKFPFLKGWEEQKIRDLVEKDRPKEEKWV
ncbi:MAG: 2TM domain-containing protein [Bacteroidota bacterium]